MNRAKAADSGVGTGHASKQAILSLFQGQKRAHLRVKQRQAKRI